MHPANRIVTQIPLSELWDQGGILQATRGDALDREQLRRLLQAGAVRFVVADAGLPLRWVPESECHVFWKLDVRPHLVDEPERPFDIYHFSQGYAYVATAWSSAESAAPPIVLLERHH
jgi:hypothetical protein